MRRFLWGMLNEAYSLSKAKPGFDKLRPRGCKKRHFVGLVTQQSV
jgi:hypothetical protein